MSDTHELHRELDILPPCDLLLHAGDWTFFSKRLSVIGDLNDWLAEQRITERAILSPGNHDFYLEADPSRRSLTPDATVLIGERLKIDGLKIWASPVTPLFGTGFGIPDRAKRAQHYAEIPKDTHVLITHGPPLGILDGMRDTGEHFGCPELAQAVRRVKPLLHVFGHIHAGYGVLATEETTYINAALLGPDGHLVNEPIVMDLPKRKPKNR